jgi:hypothetical protein
MRRETARVVRQEGTEGSTAVVNTRWRASIEEAQQDARAQGKLVLIDLQ